MDAWQEKREFPRFALSVDVEYAKIEDGGHGSSSTRNISQGGACIIAYERFRENDILTLKLHLSDKRTLSINCRVAWVSEFEVSADEQQRRFDVGVEFINLPEEEKSVIADLLFKVSGNKP